MIWAYVAQHENKRVLRADRDRLEVSEVARTVVAKRRKERVGGDQRESRSFVQLDITSILCGQWHAQQGGTAGECGCSEAATLVRPASAR